MPAQATTPVPDPPLKPPPPPGPVTPVYKRNGLDFSLTGLIYCAVMLFLGVAAINTQANLLFGVFGLMIGILLISGTISRVIIRKIRLRRILPDHGTVGRPMPITYELTNLKRFWPTLCTFVSELEGVQGFVAQPQGYLLHAAPGMTASVPAEVKPKRRGVQKFNKYQLGSGFPFGFVKRSITRAREDHVLIRPPMAEVDRQLLQLCRAAESTGETVRPRPGGQDEFYGVKEHRAGDNPRHIYWRRSARTGVLVSKEMAQVAPPRLLLLVDTQLSDRTIEQHERVERTIAMAGSLAAAAYADELSVGLCAWSDGWKSVPPSRGKRHCDDLLSILSQLTVNTTHSVDELMAESRGLMQASTTAVLFTPRGAVGPRQEMSRGRLVIVSAGSPDAGRWFKFDPAISFATAMPVDQQPKIVKRGRGARAAAGA